MGAMNREPALRKEIEDEERAGVDGAAPEERRAPEAREEDWDWSERHPRTVSKPAIRPAGPCVR